MENVSGEKGDAEAILSTDPSIIEKAKCFEKTTHFSFQECVSLLQLHAQIVEKYPLNIKFFSRSFGSLFDIKDNFILSRIHHAFDLNGDGEIDEDEWLTNLSIFMRGNFEEQIQFSFCVYDINGDGFLDREEVTTLLGDCLSEGKFLNSQEVEDGTKEIVDIVMRKLDVNGDDTIDFSDFREACYKDSLLLQSGGLFMPASKYTRRFGTMLTAPAFLTDCASTKSDKFDRKSSKTIDD